MEIEAYAKASRHGERIMLMPHRDGLHGSIIDYSMFVSSSDWEGISNSMLEAMAIGLPTICTDCPIGGAAFIIKDHGNGILVPMGDAGRMASAMAELADDEGLAARLSLNGSRLRDELTIERIGKQWLEALPWQSNG